MSRKPIEQASPVEVEISDEMLKKLEAVPDGKPGQRKLEPNAEQKAILLRFWNVKRKSDVARLLGVHENTARRWHRELTGTE